MQVRDINMIKKIWQSGILTKNIKQILSVYSKDAVVKGTFSHNATDNYNKKENYFKDLIKDIDSVEFSKNPYITNNKDILIENGKYNFITFEGGKIKANYQMVFMKINGNIKIVAHHSSLY